MKRHVTLCVLSILAACSSSPTRPVPSGEQGLALLRGVGDAVIRTEGLAAVRKYAPELEPILNPDGDQIISLQEVDAAASQILADPEMSALLLATALYLHKR